MFTIIATQRREAQQHDVQRTEGPVAPMNHAIATAGAIAIIQMRLRRKDTDMRGTLPAIVRGKTHVLKQAATQIGHLRWHVLSQTIAQAIQTARREGKGHTHDHVSCQALSYCTDMCGVAVQGRTWRSANNYSFIEPILELVDRQICP